MTFDVLDDRVSPKSVVDSTVVYLAPMKRPILVLVRPSLSKNQVTSCSGGRIRTGDLPIMSRMLSPTELRRLDY